MNYLTHLMESVPPVAVFAIIALMVGIESLGIPVPGETALIVGALLSAHHELSISPWGIWIAGFTGAIVGDTIGYSIGRRYGPSLLRRLGRRFPSHLSPAHVAYASHIFNRYGPLAVFGGRFVALLRIFAGPLSGSLNMHYPRFLIANATGGIIWAGVFTGFIYTLGTVAEHWLKNLAWVGLVLFLGGAFIMSRIFEHKMQHAVRAYADAHPDEVKAAEAA